MGETLYMWTVCYFTLSKPNPKRIGYVMANNLAKAYEAAMKKWPRRQREQFSFW